MTDRGRRSRVPRGYTRHGLTPLVKAVKSAGTGALDYRTKVGRQMWRWRRGVIEDRGGIENLSTLELDAIDQL
jgi:hypothetical protein